MDEIAILDSDSELESSPTKNPRTDHSGQSRTSRGTKKLVHDSSPPKKDFFCDKNTNNDISIIKPQTVSTQPRKTARRGLTRKNISPDSDSASSSLVSDSSLTHKKSSVYSKCVAHGYQNIFGNQFTKDLQYTNKANEELSQDNVNKRGGLRPRLTECKDASDDITVEKESGSSSWSEDDEVLLLPVNDGNTDEGSLRSPTPPPELKNSKPHRMSRKLAKALKTLNKAKASIDLPLTPTTQRGRNWGRRPILDNSLTVLEDSPAVKYDMIIKIRYLSTVHRLSLNVNQPFHLLVTKLSQLIHKEEHCLKLFLNDCSLSLTSTPKDVKLSVADIIECYSLADVEEETIEVVIQCSNSKKKTTMTANTRVPLQDLLEKYAEKSGLEVSSISFSFDGEDVSPTDTILKLEIEDGDVLDVVPKRDKNSSELSYAQRTQVITLI